MTVTPAPKSTALGRAKDFVSRNWKKAAAVGTGVVTAASPSSNAGAQEAALKEFTQPSKPAVVQRVTAEEANQTQITKTKIGTEAAKTDSKAAKTQKAPRDISDARRKELQRQAKAQTPETAPDRTTTRLTATRVASRSTSGSNVAGSTAGGASLGTVREPQPVKLSAEEIKARADFLKKYNLEHILPKDPVAKDSFQSRSQQLTFPQYKKMIAVTSYLMKKGTLSSGERDLVYGYHDINIVAGKLERAAQVLKTGYLGDKKADDPAYVARGAITDFINNFVLAKKTNQPQADSIASRN